jgi:predicted mannosyl-3-phosphoglycerate phosphatase (HAD superfamily)
MKVIIDLDGTICSEEKQFSRALAKIKDGAKESLEKLRDKGYKIIIYSARTWAEYEMTENWLKENKVPYDQIILGKPQGDYWIDDRAIRFRSWDKVINEIR